jgi:GNAT superfamily N-acetyltransferase
VIAELWRELWDAHEGWGGYPGCHDDYTYTQLAARLDDSARARGGQPALGRHLHVVATLGETVAGQVEGWVERQGADPQTPYTCEVRSLIVASWARGAGVGRALLEGLAEFAAPLARGAGLVFGAEVLEPNPAHAFYGKLGYLPVSWSLRVASDLAAGVPAQARSGIGKPFTARVAEPRDALALCLLDATLAARRRAQGDSRYDRPRAVDAATVGAIAAQLGPQRFDQGPGGGTMLQLVTADGQGQVRGAATFMVNTLDPPFLRGQRAVLGRFASDPALDAEALVAPIIALGRRLAAQAGARTIELTELAPPSTPLHRAGVASGGVPWSRILTRAAPLRGRL